MKYVLTLLVGLLLFPLASFAAYTPQQISEMEQLLSLLEQELQTLLAQQVVSVGTASVQPVMSTALISQASPVANAVVSFEVRFSVTTSSTTIDIPQNSVGVQYQISNLVSGASSSFTLTCPNVAVYNGTSYCEVPPNTTADLELIATAPTSEIAAYSGNNIPQLTVSQIKYYTNVTTGVFGYYQPAGLQTGNFLSYST